MLARSSPKQLKGAAVYFRQQKSELNVSMATQNSKLASDISGRAVGKVLTFCDGSSIMARLTQLVSHNSQQFTMGVGFVTTLSRLLFAIPIRREKCLLMWFSLTLQSRVYAISKIL
jgi:hypothetical protein